MHSWSERCAKLSCRLEPISNRIGNFQAIQGLKRTTGRKSCRKRFHVDAVTDTAAGRAEDNSQQQKVAAARKFYEEGWSSGDSGVIDSVVSAEHVQADVVWQNDERPGRESLKRGIAFIRECYPDAIFAVDETAVCTNESQIFVKWTMTGTFEGASDVVRGIALLTLDQSNLITRTEVFRQATRAEVVLAERSDKGPVKQGALLS